MGFALTSPKMQFFDNSGRLLAGGKLLTKEVGGGADKATYSDALLASPNTNPVILNARGEASVHAAAGESFWLRLTDASDVTIWTADNQTLPGTEVDVGQTLYPRTAAEIAAGVTPTNYLYAPGDVRRYGAVGDNSTDCTTAIQSAIDVAKSATAGSGGEVYLPKGDYRITAPLNMTGLFFAQNVSMRGEGRFASKIVAAFNGTCVLDLSGSVMVTLTNFGIVPSGAFVVDQVVLLARLVSNNSAGNNTFDRMYIEGNCNNAVVVLWGSEENQFINCWITASPGTPSRNFTTLVMAVKISECGFTPTSDFQTLGTGSGGVGMNTFTGCRITNECGTVQTFPLMKLYGTLGTAFYNCYFASWPGPSGHTIEINGSTYPDDPLSVYPATITFDTCSDENAWSDQSTQRTLYFGATPVGGAYNIRGISVRNCQFFQIYGADGSLVDGFDYSGGKFSNSVSSLPAAKASLYNLYNATVSVSKHERGMTWTVRNTGEGNLWRGINAGNVAKGTDTTSVIIDGSGGVTASGGLLNVSPSVSIGYGAGAGGAVTQITSAGTGVTLNRPTGQITTVSLSTAPGAEEEFTLTNSTITINDVVACSTTYAGAGTPSITAKGLANGSCRIVITNLHPSNALNAVVVINFAVIRGITS